MAPESIQGGADYSEVIVDAIEKIFGAVLVLTAKFQVIEAYGDVSTVFGPLVRAVRFLWNS